jgi:hypothetical protein
MEHGQEWTAGLTKMIGERVAFYRKRVTDERGRMLTAVGLAERCSKLGLKIERPAIAKLETGHRQTITIGEILVLAAALEVTPAALLFPVGFVPSMDVLPGDHKDPWDAYRWFAGADGESDDPVSLWREHLRIEGEIERMDTFRAHSMDPAHRLEGARPPLVTPQIFADNIDVLTGALRRVREAMREAGMAPPQLRPETVSVIGEEI